MAQILAAQDGCPTAKRQRWVAMAMQGLVVPLACWQTRGWLCLFKAWLEPPSKRVPNTEADRGGQSFSFVRGKWSGLSSVRRHWLMPNIVWKLEQKSLTRGNVDIRHSLITQFYGTLQMPDLLMFSFSLWYCSSILANKDTSWILVWCLKHENREGEVRIVEESLSVNKSCLGRRTPSWGFSSTKCHGICGLMPFW